METKQLLLNNYQVNDKILKKYLERNENMACHNQWKAAKAVLKFITIQDHPKK